MFQGDVKADIEYQVYRDMRSACRKNWAKFTPKVCYFIEVMIIFNMYTIFKDHQNVSTESTT